MMQCPTCRKDVVPKDAEWWCVHPECPLPLPRGIGDRREHEVSMEEIANLRSNYKDLQANCSRVVEENERLTEALRQIDEWSRAYPLKAFPEPDFARAAVLLKAGGMTLDGISASNMRHVVEGVGKIARDALAAQDARVQMKKPDSLSTAGPVW